MVALAYFERRDNLSFGVDSAECPDIAKRRIILKREVLFLLADETPNLVKLEIVAVQIAHFLIH